MTNTKKKSYEEIEIRTTRPEEPYKLMGEITLRDFKGELNADDKRILQKELFRLQVDGIWLERPKRQSLPGMQVGTLNSNKESGYFHNTTEEILVRMGYPYRYLPKQDQK